MKTLRERIKVDLTYSSGQSYSQFFSNFEVKVSRDGVKRVKISFREKENCKGHASFSLPFDKAQQLAYAVLTASAGDAKPIEFAVDESVGARSVAA